MRGELTQYDRSAQIVLHLTRAELLLLAGSVNEAIDAVADWEFPIRVGAEKARETSAPTLEQMYERMGFVRP